MRVLGWLADMASGLKQRLDTARLERRWRRLRTLGMRVGEQVNLPASTWIDDSHCFLISIGDRCGFGEQCHILAHDAQMNEFLNATRIGRVIIHPSCHIGARTVILPGVEIGPRTIVGANSVVSRSLPPDTVCAGAPAKAICSLEEYLEKHRRALATAPLFLYATHDISVITPEQKAAMVTALSTRDGYVTGGHEIMLRGKGGPALTASASVGGHRKKVRP
jgi:maltose O-acetyltransferase